MKFLTAQLLALCGIVACISQSVTAQEVTACDIDCIGPYNACGWEALTSSDQNGELQKCETAHDKCVSDCIAKNGKVKFVYTEAPQPEADETTPTPSRTKKPHKSKTAKPGNASLRAPDY